MNTLVYENEKYLVTCSDSVTVGVRPTGVNRVKIMTVKGNGEITVISRCVPWLYETLQSMEATK